MSRLDSESLSLDTRLASSSAVAMTAAPSLVKRSIVETISSCAAGFGCKFMDVVDDKTTALTMKLAKTVHVVRFDGSRESFGKVGAAGHGDGSIVSFVGPSSSNG